MPLVIHIATWRERSTNSRTRRRVVLFQKYDETYAYATFRGRVRTGGGPVPAPSSIEDALYGSISSTCVLIKTIFPDADMRLYEAVVRATDEETL